MHQGLTSDPRVIEEVGMSYGKIKVEVKGQNTDGSMGATVTGTWDVKQNKEWSSRQIGEATSDL